MGPRTFLTDAEEQVIVDHVHSAQGRKLPVTKDTIMSLISSLLSDKRNLMYVIKDGHFKLKRLCTFKPGEAWFEFFLKRHPNIVTRMGESLSASKRNVNQQDVKQWFADVLSYIGENFSSDILYKANRNFNIDELWFGVSPIVATKDKEMERLTVLTNICADGSIPPPLFIYQNQHIPITEYTSFPTKISAIAIGESESGQMNNDLLYEYLCGSFDEWLTYNKIQRPVIVWADKHEPLMQYYLVNRLAELQIILILIPPNTSHFMQPVDVGILAPMKKAWKKCVKDFEASRSNGYVTEENFARIFLPVYAGVMRKDKIKNAFRKCGIHPFDIETPDYSKLTLVTGHASDADIFEGMAHHRIVERETQMKTVRKLNRTTEAPSSQSSEIREDTILSLGAKKQRISKGCDDAVLSWPRLEASLCSKREKGLSFMSKTADLDLNQSRIEATVDLANEPKPTFQLQCAQTLKGKNICINLFQNCIKIEKDMDFKEEIIDVELLNPTNVIDNDDLSDKEDELVDVELIDPSHVIDNNDLSDKEDEIVDVEILDPLHGNVIDNNDLSDKEDEMVDVELLDPSPVKYNNDLSDKEDKTFDVELFDPSPVIDDNDLSDKEDEMVDVELLDPSPVLDNNNLSDKEDEVVNVKLHDLSPQIDDDEAPLSGLFNKNTLSRPIPVLEDSAKWRSNKIVFPVDLALKDMTHSYPTMSSEANLDVALKLTGTCGIKTKKENRPRRKLNRLCPCCDIRPVGNSKKFPDHIIQNPPNSNTQNFPCCDSSFTRNKNLKRHILSSHERLGLKPFKWPSCDYTSNLKSTLSNHIGLSAVLEIARPFKCPACDYACSQRKYLSRHFRLVHERVRRFCCFHCGYLCRAKPSLLTHKTIVHNKLKQFMCSSCIYTSNSKVDLFKHIQSMHMKILIESPQSIKEAKQEPNKPDKLEVVGELTISLSNEDPRFGLNQRITIDNEFFDKNKDTGLLAPSRTNQTTDSSMNKELRRSLKENKYPFLKECFVRVERLPRDFAANKDTDSTMKDKLKRVSEDKLYSILKECIVSVERLPWELAMSDVPKYVASNYAPSCPKLCKCPKSLCCQYFTNMESLINHVKIHEQFKCSFCDKTYLTKNHLSAHLISDHEKPPTVKCPNAPIAFGPSHTDSSCS